MYIVFGAQMYTPYSYHFNNLSITSYFVYVTNLALNLN